LAAVGSNSSYTAVSLLLTLQYNDIFWQLLAETAVTPLLFLSF